MCDTLEKAMVLVEETKAYLPKVSLFAAKPCSLAWVLLLQNTPGFLYSKIEKQFESGLKNLTRGLNHFQPRASMQIHLSLQLLQH
jgi:hypothetical protein